MRTFRHTARTQIPAILAALGLATQAHAAAILQAIEKNGGAIAPTSNLGGLSPGDQFLLSVLFVDEFLDGGPQNAEQIDIVWDDASADTLDVGTITNNAFGLIGGATGFVLFGQGDFDGSQPSAARISSAFTFVPATLNGSGGTALFTVAPGAAPGTYGIEIGFDNAPIAFSIVSSGATTDFVYTIPEPATPLLLGLGLVGLVGAGRRGVPPGRGRGLVSARSLSRGAP